MKSLRLPARLYICPICHYSNPYRWVLAQHLSNVHGLRKPDSVRVAAESEYWANPHHFRAQNIEDLEEDLEEEE